MVKFKNILLTIAAAGVFITAPSFAADAYEGVSTDSDLAVTQTLELNASEISSLQFSAVENEAKQNNGEIRQEASVGRSGLQGNCTEPAPCWICDFF